MQRTLIALAALSLIRAIALIGIATALARGIVSVIDGTDEWRSALAFGGVSAVVRAATSWCTDIVTANAAAREKDELRAELGARVLARGGRDLEEGQGELTVLATRGLDDLDDYFARFLPSLVAVTIVPAVIGARILFADWVSALIVALTIPLVPIFMILIGVYTRDRVSEASRAQSRLANHLVELARGLPVLVGLGRAGEQTAALREISERYRSRTMATLRIAFLSALALELIATISVAVVAVFIGVRLDHGSLGLETGLLVLILAPDCYLPFREVGAAHHAAENGREAMRRVRAILARTPSALVAAKSGEVGHISVRELSVQYVDRETPAVDDLSFRASAGSFVLLDGPSGSGKSTALAVIAGLTGSDEARGTIVKGEIAGIDRDCIAWVSQHPTAIADSVLVEVEFAAGDAVGVNPRTALERLGISHLSARHPAELSPGEFRRLAMARALVRLDTGANVLLLDEPTAHLDAESAQRIAAIISELAGSVTIVAASHDPVIQGLADLRVPMNASINAPTESISIVSNFSGTDEPSRLETDVPHEIQSPTLSIRETLRRLSDLLDLRNREFALALAFGLLAAISAVSLAALSGWLIVRASEQPPILQLMVAIVGVRFFGIGRAVFRYCERLFTHGAILESTSRLRLRVWEGLIAQGPAMRRRLRGDSALDSLIGDVDRLRDLTPRVLFPPLVGALTGMAACTGLGIVYLPSLPVMVACLIASLVIAPALSRWRDRSNGAVIAELSSKHLRRFAAVFGAATDLRASGLDEVAIAETRAIDAEIAAVARKSAIARGVSNALVIASCVAASLAMIWIAATRGGLSAEMVAVIALTPLALIDPFLAAVAALQQAPALETTLARLNWIEGKRSPEVVPARGGLLEIPNLESINLERVEATWPGSAEPIIRGLSTELRRGDWLSLTGPSGSGKSTLLSVMMAFLSPSGGTYRQNGFDTKAMSSDAIRRSIAWCPQEAFLFDSTLKANLLVARPRDEAPGEIEMIEVLDQVGLGPLVRGMPEGLNTRIGSQGSHLSGGERQRVAIARALLTGADAILIDEPTANLDRVTADQLMADLRLALNDRIVVAVTHNPDDIAIGDLRIDLSPSFAVSSLSS